MLTPPRKHPVAVPSSSVTVAAGHTENMMRSYTLEGRMWLSVGGSTLNFILI